MFSLPEAAFWLWNITHGRFLHELLKEFLDLCGYWGVLGVVPMYTKTRNVSLLYSINWVNVALFSCIPRVYLLGCTMYIWVWLMLAEVFFPSFWFVYDVCIIMVASASKLVFPSAHVYIWWQISPYSSLYPSTSQDGCRFPLVWRGRKSQSDDTFIISEHVSGLCDVDSRVQFLCHLVFSCYDHTACSN
jgi:hypothetical protein